MAIPFLSTMLKTTLPGLAVKKAMKAHEVHKKEKKLVKKGQKMALEKEKALHGAYKGGIHELKNVLKHKRDVPSGLGDIIQRYEKAGRGAEKIFAPVREQALANYSQKIVPETVGRLSEGTAGSSALNQALAASRANLERGLASDFASLQSNLAQNLLSTSQQAKQQNLQNRFNAVGQILQQPTAYSPVTQASPSPWSSIFPIATTAIGGALGGPGGAAIGSQLGGALSPTLFG